LHNLIYDKNSYVGDVVRLFNSIGTNRSSRILDTCAGTGFISLYLRQLGYNVDCMDLMDDEIKTFKRNAKSLGVSLKIKKLSWNEIPTNFSSETYDFLFCRGNSFIYADGGWNENQDVSKERSLESYKQTLKIFYDSLKQGGYLYVDKFPDNETPHNDVVAKIKVGETEEDLVFYTQRFPEKGYRKASMTRRGKDGKESSVPNITYNLKEGELEEMAKEVGFNEINRLKLDSENHFNVWLLRK